jgi:hypothetical protein
LVDASAGGLFVPDGISSQCFSTAMIYYIYLFLKFTFPT